MDTIDQGMSHPFKGPGVVANGLTGINNASVKCLFLFSVYLHRHKCRGLKAQAVGPYFENCQQRYGNNW